MPDTHRFKNQFILSKFVSIQETASVETENPLKLENVNIVFKIKNIES